MYYVFRQQLHTESPAVLETSANRQQFNPPPQHQAALLPQPEAALPPQPEATLPPQPEAALPPQPQAALPTQPQASLPLQSKSLQHSKQQIIVIKRFSILLFMAAGIDISDKHTC